jgi:hypothetical protein
MTLVGCDLHYGLRIHAERCGHARLPATPQLINPRDQDVARGENADSREHSLLRRQPRRAAAFYAVMAPIPNEMPQFRTHSLFAESIGSRVRVSALPLGS